MDGGGRYVHTHSYLLSSPSYGPSGNALTTVARPKVYDRATFYTATAAGGGSDGYTDYPSMDGSMGKAGKYKTIAQDLIGGGSVAAAAAAQGRSKL